MYRWAAITSAAVPSWGGTPVRHSCSTMPSAYRSLAAVPGLPAIRSGAMYWVVPMTRPGPVTGTWPAAWAMPKSVTLTVPSPLIRMLPGLMSRWMTPTLCAAASPSAACAITLRAWAGAMGSTMSRSASDGPSTNSITR